MKIVINNEKYLFIEEKISLLKNVNDNIEMYCFEDENKYDDYLNNLEKEKNGLNPKP